MDAFWSHNVIAKLGISTIEVEIRFETMMGSFDSKEQSYRIWLAFCQNPTFLYSTVLSSSMENIKGYGQNFPGMLHKLIENCTVDPKMAQIDLVNEDPDQLSMVVRETQNCMGSSTRMNWFGCRLNLANDTAVRTYLLSMITNLKKERDDERNLRIQKELEVEQLAKINTLQEEQLKNIQQIFQIIPCQGHQHTHQVPDQIMIHNSSTSATTHATPISPNVIFTTATSEARQGPKISPISSNLSSMSERLLSLTQSSGQAQISPQGDNSAENTGLPKPKTGPTPTQTFAEKNEDLLLGIATYLFCALCPPQEQVTSQNSDEMKRHFIDAHLDDQKRQCQACPDTDVVNGNDLLSHMKIHMNRIYACRFCGKKGRKHFLKSHIRIHTGERPYQCQVCTRSFADQSTFRRHQAIHTGLKKYSCPICGRIMSRKDNVKVHLRSHHNAQDLSPAPTPEAPNTSEATDPEHEPILLDEHKNSLIKMEEEGD